MVAAAAALGDREWLDAHVRAIVTERERLGELLSEAGWLAPLPSQTNFVLVRVLRDLPGDGPRGLRLKNALERHGVLVRYFDKDGLRDCIRVSVGKPEHTEALVKAISEYRIQNTEYR
jgi:histidinol-phosphate aminotransferase